MKRFNFGAYLKAQIGDAPAGIFDPHAHHILFKDGIGLAQKVLVRQGQALLRQFDIDLIYGLENLVWAPNHVVGQHSGATLRHTVDTLRQVRDAGGTRSDMVEALRKLGELASQRGGGND